MPWPVYAPVTEGDLLRGWVSPQIGGHSLPCSATNALFGIVPKDTIKKAFEKLFPGGGPGTDDVEFVFTARTRVPAGGALYLEIGEVNCLAAGVTAISDTVLTGISVRVDKVDAARNYDIEVVTGPSGGAPVIQGSLALVNALFARRDDLAVTISGGTEWGVRISKTNAAVGRSIFGNIVVVVRMRN